MLGMWLAPIDCETLMNDAIVLCFRCMFDGVALTQWGPSKEGTPALVQEPHDMQNSSIIV